MGNLHQFHRSLSKGKAAEKKFLELFGDRLKATDGRTVDFIINKSGLTIELKTDFYDPAKTPNLFMERWSRDGVDGGPFQALSKGASYFVYWFPVTNEFFVFETAPLVAHLEQLKLTLVPVQNIGFTTYGYKVNRAQLEKLRLKLEDIL